MTNEPAGQHALATRRGGITAAAALSSVLFGASTVASACTVCDSEIGQQVRAGIFGGDFWSTMLAVFAPFAVTLAAVALVMFALFGAPRQSNAPRS